MPIAEKQQPSPGDQPSGLDSFLDHIVSFVTSLRLTVVCLALGLVLVFAGTIAQVDLGLYKAQNEYFRSLLVFWGPKDVGWKIPVLPGGYLVGGVLLVNLIAAQLKRFRFSIENVGLWMVHVGLILLLLGQLGTDLLSRESFLHLRQGESKNYSEAPREAELAIVDTTEPDLDKVVAIPQSVLAHKKEIRHQELPFAINVKNYYANSVVEDRKPNEPGAPPATQGAGANATIRELPRVTEMERRDVPSAVVEFVTPQGSLGTWLVSEYVDRPQVLTVNNRTYQLSMRPRRFYKPFSLGLLEFRFDRYAGTDIPKNFSSRVRLQRPDTGEDREVLIFMNNPLRYGGETFYQADWDKDDEKGTTLQVVRNPSWLTPYLSCILVGLGLAYQFGTNLLGFTFKRRTA